MDFSIDAGLFCGLILLGLSIFYYVNGDLTYSWYNLGISFLASLNLMLTSLIGLNAAVKGLAGPTSAILNTNSIVQTILNAIFL